eukprot:42600-Prymnesium_polylepis.3
MDSKIPAFQRRHSQRSYNRLITTTVPLSLPSSLMRVDGCAENGGAYRSLKLDERVSRPGPVGGPRSGGA